VVPALLNHDIEHLAFVVDSAPEVHALASDRADDLVQMPARGGGWPLPFQVPGDERAELGGPTADGLITDLDSALSEHLLDVAEAKGEAEIEPHRVTNDVRRKPVTLE